MSAVRYGIGPNEVVAQPDFRVRRDAEGKTTGSRTFTIRTEDKTSPSIQTRFAKGARIADISPDLGAYWNFLLIESHEMEDQPGGYCRVVVECNGYTASGDFDFDREKTYTLRGVLSERPMIEHPNYIAEVPDAGNINEHQAIVALYHGTAFVTDATATYPEVRSLANQEVIIYQIDEADSLKWFGIIITDGRRTYLAPQYEWTVEETNAGGLTGTELADFGKKVDTPPGEPPTPTGVTGWWQFVDLADMRSSNSASNSRTYRFNEGSVLADVYDY